MPPKMRCIAGCEGPIYGLQDALHHREFHGDGHDCEPIEYETEESYVGSLQFVSKSGKVTKLGEVFAERGDLRFEPDTEAPSDY